MAIVLVLVEIAVWFADRQSRSRSFSDVLSPVADDATGQRVESLFASLADRSDEDDLS